MWIWTSIIFILVIVSTSVRQSIYGVIRAATRKKILVPFFIIIIYSLLWVKFLSTLPIWEWKNLKDIILWVLFIGVPICFNAVIEKSEYYYWDLLKSNFMFVIFIEFLVSTFTFSLVIEMILVPIATFLVLIKVIASSDKAYKATEKFISVLQVIFGFLVLYFAIKSAIQHYIELDSLDLFVTFSIPIIMTFLIMPLAYIYAVYAAYEELFILMKFRVPQNNKITRKANWKIINICKFSRKRVNTFKTKYLVDIYTTMSEKELKRVLERFRLSNRT